VLLLLLLRRTRGEVVMVDVVGVPEDEAGTTGARWDDGGCGGRGAPLSWPLVETAPVAGEADVAAPSRRVEAPRVVECGTRGVELGLHRPSPHHLMALRERDGGHGRVSGRRHRLVGGECPRSADGQRAGGQHHGHGRTQHLMAAHGPPLSTPEIIKMPN